MLFSELYKIIANKVAFVGFRGGSRPNHPPGSAPVCDNVISCSVDAVGGTLIVPGVTMELATAVTSDWAAENRR